MPDNVEIESNECESSRCEKIVNLFVDALIDNRIVSRDDQQEVKDEISKKMSNVKSIKEAIFEIRNFRDFDSKIYIDLRVESRNRMISQIIIRDLAEEGKFLVDQEKQPYLFCNDSKEVFPIGTKRDPGIEYISFLNDHYGTNMTSNEGKFIIEEIRNYALIHGETIEVHDAFHWDDDNQVLYIHNRHTQNYVLDGKNINIVSNGTNGVYFRSQGGMETKTPIEYLPIGNRPHDLSIEGEVNSVDQDESLLQRVLVNRINFTEDEELTVKDQKLLLWYHLHTIPFGDRMTSKPILIFAGEKGSGKTMALRMLGKFLMGQKYELSDLPDEKNFFVVAVNSTLFFIDNVNCRSKWLQDALAVTATGVRSNKRKLYSDFEMTSGTPKCFVGLTTSDPTIFSDYVIDRTIFIHTRRFESFVPEVTILSLLQKHQNVLWSWYIDDLNLIIQQLKATPCENFRSSHRLADWALMCDVIGKALGINKEETTQLLDRMEKNRAEIATQCDQVSESLHRWSETKNNQGEWLTSENLHRLLSANSTDYRRLNMSKISLGKKLQTIKLELKTVLGMEIQRNDSKKVWEYRFPKKEI